jgi:hypothetical protein
MEHGGQLLLLNQGTLLTRAKIGSEVMEVSAKPRKSSIDI